MSLHLAWPPEVITKPDGSKVFATVEQDSDTDIQMAAALLCELRPGQLPWAPELGIPDPLGTSDPESAAALIEAALNEQDGREPIRVEVLDDPDAGRHLTLTISTEEA